MAVLTSSTLQPPPNYRRAAVTLLTTFPPLLTSRGGKEFAQVCDDDEGWLGMPQPYYYLRV